MTMNAQLKVVLFFSGGVLKGASSVQQMAGHSPLRNIVLKIILKRHLGILRKPRNSPPSNNQLNSLHVNQTNIILKTTLNSPLGILRKPRLSLLQNNLGLLIFPRVKQITLIPRTELNSPLRILRNPGRSILSHNLLKFLRVKQTTNIPKKLKVLVGHCVVLYFRLLKNA